MRADLSADLVSLEITREASLWRVAAAEYLLEQIGDARAQSLPDSIADMVNVRNSLPEVSEVATPTLLARVNLVRGVTAARSGYESLINAGNLRLIDDPELRTAIQRYYAGYENFESNLSIFREIRATALPILYRNGFSIFSDQPVGPVIEAARTDPALVAYIATSRDLGLVQVSSTLGREADAQALLALLNSELDGSGR